MISAQSSNVTPIRPDATTSAMATPTLQFKGSTSGGGNGGMDDVLRRLHTVEQIVSEIRSDVAGLTAVIPHLATKADVADVKTSVSDVRGNISSLESSLIKWMIGTALAVTVLAFTIARYVAPAGP